MGQRRHAAAAPRRLIVVPSSGRATVAVVICTYTLARWDDLVRAVESVRRQTLQPAQLIVVVDHNEDLLSRASAELGDCQVVANRHPAGLSGGRNTGIEACASQIVAFLDDDAHADADWLELLSAPFEREHVVAAGGRAIPAWAAGRPPWFPPAFDWVVGCSYEGLPSSPARVRNVLGCNMAFRADLIRGIGGFRTELGRTATSATGVEETELCIRLAQADPAAEIMFLPAAMVTHAVPAERATWRYFRRRCMAEGRSKAVLTGMVGQQSALESERRYTTRVLPAAAGRAVREAVERRNLAPLTAVAAIVGGLVLTSAGYAWGRLTRLRSVAAADQGDKAIARPRIAMVCSRFLPMTGGTEMHVAEVAPRIALAGLAVEVLTTDGGGSLPRRSVFHGIRVYRSRIWPRRGDLFLAPGLFRRLLAGTYDVVHVQGVHTLVAPLAMASALITRTPLVVTFHTGGHRSRLRNRLRRLQWAALGPLLRRADALIAVSMFERELFARALRVPRNRIQVIPNGSDVRGRPAGAHEDPDLVVSAGRLERYKGHHRVIAALPHLVRRRPDARVLVLGDGPERESLIVMARDLGVSDRVTIRSIPADDRATMIELLGSAGLVALLSQYEAHPLAVTEALALRRRILVADTSGLSEIAERGLARSVALDATPEELADAMSVALDQPPSDAAVAIPSWDDCADAIRSVYLAALGR